MSKDPPPRSTLELTAAVAGGDPEALAELYRRYFDSLYAEVRRSTGRGEEFCLDVVQDVMIRVIKSLDPMEAEAALARWLVLTARSVSIDHLRRDARRARRERIAAERSAERRRDGADAATEERLQWIRGELPHLGDGERALLALRIGRERTLGEIGVTTGLRTGAVDGRLRRLIASLERRAREVFGDD